MESADVDRLIEACQNEQELDSLLEVLHLDETTTVTALRRRCEVMNISQANSNNLEVSGFSRIPGKIKHSLRNRSNP